MSRRTSSKPWRQGEQDHVHNWRRWRWLHPYDEDYIALVLRIPKPVHDSCRYSSCRLETSRSHRILWLLEELKVPYELKTYKREKSKLADPKLKEVHPLGKSPVVEIESPALAKPLVLAESGAIVEYLCDHFGKWLIPKRYQEGKEDQVGGETESWLRNRMYMHYAEGSIMPLNVIGLLVQSM